MTTVDRIQVLAGLAGLASGAQLVGLVAFRSSTVTLRPKMKSCHHSFLWLQPQGLRHSPTSSAAPVAGAQSPSSALAGEHRLASRCWLRHNNSLEPTLSGRPRKPAVLQIHHGRTPGLRGLPPGSAQLERYASDFEPEHTAAHEHPEQPSLGRFGSVSGARAQSQLPRRRLSKDK
jgi:hypothetical protein